MKDAFVSSGSGLLDFEPELRALRPDVLVKGGDYDESSIVGATDVRGWGGDVRVIPLTPGQSTTNIIRTLRGSHTR